MLFSVAAALAVSAPVVAQARHGADDGTVQLRHRADDRATADRSGRTKHVSRASTTELRGGADDTAGDDHGGHGRDDGPGHH